MTVNGCANVEEVVALLRSERLRQKMSLRTLAQSMGQVISHVTLYRIEGGQIADPGLGTLSGMAVVLGLDLRVTANHRENETPTAPGSAVGVEGEE
jgi:transcriptional regulator with XRE-family HTH domain